MDARKTDDANNGFPVRRPSMPPILYVQIRSDGSASSSPYCREAPAFVYTNKKKTEKNTNRFRRGERSVCVCVPVVLARLSLRDRLIDPFVYKYNNPRGNRFP